MATAAQPPAGSWNRASYERELRETRRLAARVGSTALLFVGTPTTALISKIRVRGSRRGAGRGDAPPSPRLQKPLFMTFLSFVAMALCLVPRAWNTRPRETAGENRGRVRRRRSRADGTNAELTRGLLSGDSSGSGNEGTAPSPERDERSRWTLPPVLPALLGLVPITLADLVATAHPPTACCTSRCRLSSCFATVSSSSRPHAVLLRRTLNDLHKLGMSLSFSGVALVALAAILADPEKRAHTARGMAYVAVSQAVQAAQLTFEGYFLRDLSEVFETPTAMVGAEGMRRRRAHAMRRPSCRGAPGLVPRRNGRRRRGGEHFRGHGAHAS